MHYKVLFNLYYNGLSKALFFTLSLCTAKCFKTIHMHTSRQWIEHFRNNLRYHRINWDLSPTVSPEETAIILRSLQAWQLGETSDGKNLLRAVTKYAQQHNDPDYVQAMTLFIMEEQKHGKNLGRYLDAIGQPRIKKDWGDTLFRKFRGFNTSMEMWTLAVLTVESAAQVFYQALKDATYCVLLKQICRDILIDEACHIAFQTERMTIIFEQKSGHGKMICAPLYKFFYFGTALAVWIGHRRLLRAGGNTYRGYMRKMHYKYIKTLHRITSPKAKLQPAFI